MMLGELLKGCDWTKSSSDGVRFLNTEVSGVAYDSRNVEEGCLFVATRGERHDGHDFVKEAIGKGAVAAVVEREVCDIEDRCILVKDGRKALACISNNFCGRPSERLTLIGITGTNGKTTVTYILKSVLESWGKNVGLIGTIRYMIKDEVYPAAHTTPEALEFQGLLRTMLLSGCTHVVTEVSSHALAQYRVDGAAFHAAVFTNLTRDHLDFHKTMEDYFTAKERLFSELLGEGGTAVINLDDQYGKRLGAELRRSRTSIDILTYGLDHGADITASGIEFSPRGLSFKISFRGSEYDASSGLTGLPNVYNIMSAIGVSVSLGVPWKVILDGIGNSAAVPGRFEKIDEGQNFLCVVDYAHTEDALERLIYTAKGLISSSALSAAEKRKEGKGCFPFTVSAAPRIITVFGCGGDRDRGKRPKMGEIATSLSDRVIVTSDNPRSEDPADIIKDILSGAVVNNYLVEPDRKKAIEMAVGLAGDGDIVLIAGKGHEDYQEINGVRYPFRDKDVATEAIKTRHANPGIGK